MVSLLFGFEMKSQGMHGPQDVLESKCWIGYFPIYSPNGNCSLRDKVLVTQMN